MTDQLPPRGFDSAPPLRRSRGGLTAEQIEAILAEDTELGVSDRRNLETKLENLRYAEQERERTNAMSAREIVDSIPRGFDR